jgi:hypothetical protein
MNRWLDLDRLGMGLSLACALHCLAAPMLFALLPALGLALHSFQDPMRPVSIALLRLEGWHLHVVLATIAFAGVVLLRGWRRHRRRLPLALLAAALVAFAIGLDPGRAAVSGWVHALALACGGILTALAHAANRRAVRGVPA